jgi:hypothetical protein
LKQRKLFSNDKNFILREVQHSSRNTLLKELVRLSKEYYLSHHNPLGLIDDIINQIKASTNFPSEAFDAFYHDLCAIYRYQYGEVQLEFLFDGRSHWQKYENDWVEFFKKQCTEFCANRFFLRAVLDIAVFHNRDRVAYLAGDRLKYFLTQYYEMKVYKYRGIKAMRAS